MEEKWIKLEDERPTKEGQYVVIIANPYTKPVKNTLQIQYWFGDRFEREISGASYLAYWLKDLEQPEMTFEEANKLSKLTTK